MCHHKYSLFLVNRTAEVWRETSILLLKFEEIYIVSSSGCQRDSRVLELVIHSSASGSRVRHASFAGFLIVEIVVSDDMKT